MPATESIRRRETGRVRLLSLLAWTSFAAFLISSESFRRFCHEVTRLAGKL